MIRVACSYGAYHVYPDDWIFGGAGDLDPRADPRYMPDTYFYYDYKLREIYMTQTPLCDDMAIDNFTLVEQHGHFKNSESHPRYLGVRRNGENEIKLLPWRYNYKNDTVYADEEISDGSHPTHPGEILFGVKSESEQLA